MKMILVTGGFDPIHSGHIAYFKAARELGDHLIVGLNSDAWLTRKKGRPFMPVDERATIVKELECVDEVITFNDDDNTACLAIGYVLQTKATNWKLIFANGGDRTNTTTPEYETWGNHPDVEFAFGVGGEDKKNSSSWILEDYKAPKTIRNWGYYRVLHEVHGPLEPTMVVKELTVDPGKSLSMQYHNYRNEYWIVSEGIATLKRNDSNDVVIMHKHENTTINKKEWHQLSNETTDPLRVVEIQYGDICIEEDIIRS